MSKILIIEPNKEIRFKIDELTQRNQHVTTLAIKGVQAIKYVNHQVYDLIIMNLNLPQITGTELIKGIRQSKKNKLTPVIMLSGQFDKETVQILTKANRITLIVWPTEDHILSGRVETTLASYADYLKSKRYLLKNYTFKPETLKICQTIDSATEEKYLPLYPALLNIIDVSEMNFGIWVKGSKEILEYISGQFSAEQNQKRLEELIKICGRQNTPIQLLIRRADKSLFFDHIKRVREGQIDKVGLGKEHREFSNMFIKLCECAAHFMTKDVDDKVISDAEEIAVSVAQTITKNQQAESEESLFQVLSSNPILYDHVTMVTILSVAVGKILGFQESQLKTIALGAMLHDIGLASLNISDFYKKKSTEQQKTLYRSHPLTGVDELNDIETSGIQIPEQVYTITLQHHENFNGLGFPNGKKGTYSQDNPGGIHIMAAVVGIADKYSLYFAPDDDRPKYDVNQATIALSRLDGYFEPVVHKAFNVLMGHEAPDDKTLNVVGHVKWILS